MTCFRAKIGGCDTILTFTGKYQPGDQPPTGYTAWHAWADVQHKAGLRQARCGRCGLWQFPQELSGVIDESHPEDRHGNVVVMRSPVCNGCLSKEVQP